MAHGRTYRDPKGIYQDRRRAIAVLDFSAMAPRLAYASVGATPPPGDIYALPGLDGASACCEEGVQHAPM